ncbi:MAG: chromosomal replication initiator protein DnaA [bacterium]|nr:chromosomal replication initiator protein DnaA [bacterium]
MVAIRDIPPASMAVEQFMSDEKPKLVRMGVEELFYGIINTLKKRLTLFVWQGFFDTLVPISLVEDVLTLAATSTFHKDWMTDHYLYELCDVASHLYGSPIKITIIDNSFENSSLPVSMRKSHHLVRDKTKEKVKELELEFTFGLNRDQISETQSELIPELIPEPKLELMPELENELKPRESIVHKAITPLRAPQIEKDTGTFNLDSNPFNANYNFDSFVPGPSNQMAFTACAGIAEQTSAQFSPLFLFGPVGIGKTHLIHAIGHAARAQNPNISILYMSAEQWVNAYIQAIRERKFDAFRKKFRSGCDILLIDDIQFLAGKDASQDEFFHTFNSLHQARKQIVLTSDKYPHEIEGLEERLRTRLSWGLVADIRPPEIETRIAILYKKAESLQITLSNEVAYYLASQISTSVRELEGALLRLSVFLKVTKSQISLDAAKEYLSPIFRTQKATKTSPGQICKLVAKYYNLSTEDLFNKNRQQPVALARQVAIFLCRTLLTLSLPEIGRFFGGRDHSTILSSIRKIEAQRHRDIGLQVVITRLEKEVFSCMPLEN